MGSNTFIMKYIMIVVIFLSVSLFLKAETNECINITPNTACLAEEPGGGDLHHITFYGILDMWWTPSGALIIDCDPPFSEVCYNLWWSLTTSQKFVRLNDANQTEIDVTSDPVITPGENGDKIHTFTR
ncbi:MAG: hypothetical protein DRI89_01705 [Bacteroidetes bacterium]|nr:MAG: hypothetical protein DRI89_01705 [Bacteroidota bacterium]